MINERNLLKKGNKTMKIAVYVDLQSDFIDGALGTKEAQAIVPAVKSKIENFDGRVIFTRDTHFADYLDTQEGANLPVKHCIKDTDGWQIRADLDALRKTPAVDKLTFGSAELGEMLKAENEKEPGSADEKIKLLTAVRNAYLTIKEG